MAVLGGATIDLTLQRGNVKLGPDVHTISRTPGPIEMGGTCPGASEWCKDACYAIAIAKRFKSARLSWQRNTVADTIPELPDDGLFRINVAGDLDTPEFIDQMAARVAAKPMLETWVYTRSWAVDDPALRSSLLALGRLPNVQMFASIDPSMTGLSRIPRSWRRAWIAGDPRINGGSSIVCPEQRVGHGAGVTCQSCKFCTRAPKNNKRDVVFEEH